MTVVQPSRPRFDKAQDGHPVVRIKVVPAKMVKVPGYSDGTYACGCVHRLPARHWKKVCDTVGHYNGIPGVRTKHGWGCQCQGCVMSAVG